MYYLIAPLVASVLSLVAGGYLGYKYGRKVEAKAQAAYAAAKLAVEAVKLG